MSKLETLEDGLIDQLKDLYSAEKQLMKALPKMEKKASNEKLKKAFQSHLEETKTQVERLEEISSILEQKLTGKTCKAMEGLIEEGKEVLEEESENEALIDCLLIAAAQRVEHYEISAYGTARAMAEEIGHKDIAKLLTKTLDEESAADEKLSTISLKEVLGQASAYSEDSEEEDEEQKGKESKGKLPPKGANKSRSSSAGLRSFLLGGLLLLAYESNIALAETIGDDPAKERASMGYNADDTGKNVRDRNESRVTADDQGQGSEDVNVAAQIRREIVGNDALSRNAKNVKIVVLNEVVTLRGPVESEEEKSIIEKTASDSSPDNYRVVNQLEVKNN